LLLVAYTIVLAEGFDIREIAFCEYLAEVFSFLFFSSPFSFLLSPFSFLFCSFFRFISPSYLFFLAFFFTHYLSRYAFYHFF